MPETVMSPVDTITSGSAPVAVMFAEIVALVPVRKHAIVVCVIQCALVSQPLAVSIVLEICSDEVGSDDRHTAKSRLPRQLPGASPRGLPSLAVPSFAPSMLPP